MKTCPSCNYKNKPEDSFCNACGNPLPKDMDSGYGNANNSNNHQNLNNNQNSQQNNQQSNIESNKENYRNQKYRRYQSNYNVNNNYNNNPNQYNNNYRNTKRRKKSNIGCLIIVLVFIGIPLIAFIKYVMTYTSELEKEVNKTSNAILSEENLISNSGAENNLDGWSVDKSEDDYEEFILDVNTDNAFNGEKCFYFYPDSLDGQISQTVKMEKGEEYLLSLFTNSDDDSYGTKYAEFKFRSDEGEIIRTAELSFQSHWQKYDYTIEVPDNISTDEVNLRIAFDDSEGSYFIDDISLYKITGYKNEE
jgi:hypothetical protein